ncbi:unnamed protein product [Meganyctiphanes norvegica]|uniref:Uncharacterized protein n=1 Tax=Meganyctiphanes norvegica TaxID=48144 RepID=A0AAV2PNE4_MEGNR
MGLLMNHTVRPPVTSDDHREQTYVLSLTSYGHLNICAKYSVHIYCFNFFMSSDLNRPLVTLNAHRRQILISNFILSHNLCLHAKNGVHMFYLYCSIYEYCL